MAAKRGNYQGKVWAPAPRQAYNENEVPPEFQGPPPQQAPPPLTVFLQERKGKIGKICIKENSTAKAANAPKFRGEVFMGDCVFEVALWADDSYGADVVALKGNISRKKAY